MNDDDDDFDSADEHTLPEEVLVGLTEVFNMAASVADLQQDAVIQDEMYGLINSLADYFGIEYTDYRELIEEQLPTMIKHSGDAAQPRTALMTQDDEVVYLPDREFNDDDEEDDDDDEDEDPRSAQS